MKRRNNEHLKMAQVAIIDWRDIYGWSVDQLLRYVRKYNRGRVILSAGLDDVDRLWFHETSVARLVTYQHATRTAIYEYEGARVEVTLQRNWASGDVGEFRDQYRQAESDFARKFGFGFLLSPTLTGLYGVEASLPYRTPEATASPEFRKLLHANTTQGRGENFNTGVFDKFLYYDRRLAYPADARLDLPVGAERELTDTDFVPYGCAFYKGEFQVPSDWQHVGLLPVLGPGGWFWPRNPGERHRFECLAEPELRLAIESGWKVAIDRAWGFDAGRPLEKFTVDLSKLSAQADLVGQSIAKQIFRRIMLTAYGGLYARSYEREMFVSDAELMERNDAAMLTARIVDGGAMVQDRSEKRDERFYMPEWTAFVWSRARARLAAAMLNLRFGELIACHVDAVYCARALDSFFTGESIGKFRLKGGIESPVTIRNQRDFINAKKEAEGAFNG